MIESSKMRVEYRQVQKRSGVTDGIPCKTYLERTYQIDKRLI